MRKTSLATASLILLFASPAAAQVAAETPSETVEPQETWYGDQLLVADGSAVVLLTASTVTFMSAFCMFDCHGNEGAMVAAGGLAAGGLATYAFAPPIIHAAHGHWDKAGESFGLRLAPTAVAIPFYASGDDDIVRVGFGVQLAGSVAAAVIDDVFIAREPAEPTAIGVVPSYDPETGRFDLAAHTTF